MMRPAASTSRFRRSGSNSLVTICPGRRMRTISAPAETRAASTTLAVLLLPMADCAGPALQVPPSGAPWARWPGLGWHSPPAPPGRAEGPSKPRCSASVDSCQKCKATASRVRAACACCKRMSGYPHRDHEAIDMLLTELQAQQITLVRVLEQTRDNGGLWTAGDAHEATRAARELVGAVRPFRFRGPPGAVGAGGNPAPHARPGDPAAGTQAAFLGRGLCWPCAPCWPVLPPTTWRRSRILMWSSGPWCC